MEKPCAEDYDFQAFDKPVRLRDDFFSEPISYRYVDGRNAFYVIDRLSDVRGILRIKQPLKWSFVDRVLGNHLKPLINALSGKVWAAIVGNTRDIQIVTKLGPELRWNRNCWQYLHLDLIRSFITDFTDDCSVAEELLNLVFALSVSRTGSLILIPEGWGRPQYIGGLDANNVVAEIARTIVGMSLRQFVRGAGMFGVFGTDGLVVVRKDGTIEEAGKIVALTADDQTVSGGGRTQAARSCSRFGLAIKVSEDGPISFYVEGRLIFRTNG
jgi:hypothetical protein